MAKPLEYLRKLREKKTRAVFASLLASPGTGAFTMPAGGRIYARSTTSHVDGATVATFSGRTIKTSAIGANSFINIGWIERGIQITPSTGFEICLDIGLGHCAKIGEGV